MRLNQNMKPVGKLFDITSTEYNNFVIIFEHDCQIHRGFSTLSTLFLTTYLGTKITASFFLPMSSSMSHLKRMNEMSV